MPGSDDPRVERDSFRRSHELASTYPVQDSPFLSPEANDRLKQREIQRLAVQDWMFTLGMGGAIPEQDDPASFHRVLDIGCGPGLWAIEVAKTYPHLSAVGVDISERIIEYACAQAQAQGMSDRVEFLVMNALQYLQFPKNYFDLVNMRSGSSFVRRHDWPKMLIEMMRITHPGGVVRVTEPDITIRSNSPALSRFCELITEAFYRSGHLFTRESTSVMDRLPSLLKSWGCEQVQTRTYVLEFKANTPAGQALYEDVLSAAQNLRPFLRKWCDSSAIEGYDTLQEALREEMQRPDFHATDPLLTVWGVKPLVANEAR